MHQQKMRMEYFDNTILIQNLEKQLVDSHSAIEKATSEEVKKDLKYRKHTYTKQNVWENAPKQKNVQNLDIKVKELIETRKQYDPAGLGYDYSLLSRSVQQAVQMERSIYRS